MTAELGKALAAIDAYYYWSFYINKSIYIYIQFEFLKTLAVLWTLEKVSQLFLAGLTLYRN